MKTVTKKELDDILAQHRLWLKDGTQGKRADLRETSLRGVNLRGADLRDADLRRADLSKADLRQADLQRADLEWADLSGVKLRRADLSGANLRSAYLCGADLRRARLRGANLRMASLREAKLHGAVFRNADVTGANFDFSSGLSLACAGSHFDCGVELVHQYLAHLCTLTVTDEPEEFQAIKAAILPFAVKSHRAKDLGLMPIEQDNNLQ